MVNWCIWFVVSLNILVCGLGIMMVWRTLTRTGPLQGFGLAIIVAGLVTLVLGVWICGHNPQDGSSIASGGLAVLALGAATLFEARGRGHEKTIRVTTCFVIGIAAVGFLIALLLWLPI